MQCRGLKGNLVDREGFPRADVDVHEVRNLRHRLACVAHSLCFFCGIAWIHGALFSMQCMPEVFRNKIVPLRLTAPFVCKAVLVLQVVNSLLLCTTFFYLSLNVVIYALFFVLHLLCFSMSRISIKNHGSMRKNTRAFSTSILVNKCSRIINTGIERM
jgi:hypothetical protein